MTSLYRVYRDKRKKSPGIKNKVEKIDNPPNIFTVLTRFVQINHRQCLRKDFCDSFDHSTVIGLLEGLSIAECILRTE